MADREKEAFVRRLDTAAQRLGTFYTLSKASGVSEQTLHSYRRKGTDPSRRNLIKIAVAAGVSVEWLATGKDPVAWDAERLRDVITTIEDWLKVTRRTMKVSAKAELIVAIYEEVSQQERKQLEGTTEPRPERILRLVGKLKA